MDITLSKRVFWPNYLEEQKNNFRIKEKAGSDQILTYVWLEILQQQSLNCYNKFIVLHHVEFTPVEEVQALLVLQQMWSEILKPKSSYCKVERSFWVTWESVALMNLTKWTTITKLFYWKVCSSKRSPSLKLE